MRVAGSCSVGSSVDRDGAGHSRRLLRRRPAMGCVTWPRESAARTGGAHCEAKATTGAVIPRRRDRDPPNPIVGLGPVETLGWLGMVHARG